MSDIRLPVWHAVRGASKAAAKWMAGDRAPDDAVAVRRAECRGCPTRRRVMGVDWCGTPLLDASNALEVSERSCGCSLVKVFVASEMCPQGKWLPVQPRTNDRVTGGGERPGSDPPTEVNP